MADIDKNMRMVERRQSADAHEFARANGDFRNTKFIVKMRNFMISHGAGLVCLKLFRHSTQGAGVATVKTARLLASA